MPLRIRPADVDGDRDLLVDRLRRYLTPRADATRYDWLYRKNPHGMARVWVAVDEGSGDVVGVASAFPRRAVVDGNEAVGWVLGDFCIAESHRTLGPALQLNRACLEAVDSGSASFCYDFPSRSMMAVYRRLRMDPVGHMIRFARVLRWGPKLRDAVRVPGAGAIGAVADRWPRLRRSPRPPLTVSVQDGSCDGSYDDLDRTGRGRARIALDRSSDYLNWRFLAHPIAPHEIVTVREGTRLHGYAVFMQEGSEAMIADLSVREDATAGVLLEHLADLLRGRGVVSVSASLLASHPLVPVLRRNGFRAREENPAMFRGGPAFREGPPVRDVDLPLTHGDRES